MEDVWTVWGMAKECMRAGTGCVRVYGGTLGSILNCGVFLSVCHWRFSTVCGLSIRGTVVWLKPFPEMIGYLGTGSIYLLYCVPVNPELQ